MILSYNFPMPEMNLEENYWPEYVDQILKVVNEAIQPILFDALLNVVRNTNISQLITQTEAAKIKNCSRKAIQAAINRGDLPAYTPYNMVLWEDVLKLKIKGKD